MEQKIRETCVESWASGRERERGERCLKGEGERWMIRDLRHEESAATTTSLTH